MPWNHANKYLYTLNAHEVSALERVHAGSFDAMRSGCFNSHGTDRSTLHDVRAGVVEVLRERGDVL